MQVDARLCASRATDPVVHPPSPAASAFGIALPLNLYKMTHGNQGRMGAFLSSGDAALKRRSFRARQMLDTFVAIAHAIHTQPKKYPGRVRRAYLKFLPLQPGLTDLPESDLPPFVALIDQRYELFSHMILCVEADASDVDTAAAAIFQKNADRHAREADHTGQFDARRGREIFERLDAWDRARLGVSSDAYRQDVTRPGPGAFFKPFSDCFLSVSDFATASMQFETHDTSGAAEFARWRVRQESSANNPLDQEGVELCPARPSRRFLLADLLARLRVQPAVFAGMFQSGEVRWVHGVTMHVHLSELQPASFPDRLWPSLFPSDGAGAEPRGYFLGVDPTLKETIPGTDVRRSSMRILEDEVSTALRKKLLRLDDMKMQRAMLIGPFQACFDDSAPVAPAYLLSMKHLLAKCDNDQRFFFRRFPRRPGVGNSSAFAELLQTVTGLAAHVHASWQPHLLAGLGFFLRIKRPRENGVASCAEASGMRTPHMYFIGPPSGGKSYMWDILQNWIRHFTQSFTRQTIKSTDGVRLDHEEAGDAVRTTGRDEGAGRRFSSKRARISELSDQGVDEQNQWKVILGEGHYRSVQKVAQERRNGRDVPCFETTRASNAGTYVWFGNERGTLNEAIARRLTIIYIMCTPDRGPAPEAEWTRGFDDGDVGEIMSENATIASVLRAAATCRLLHFPFHNEGKTGLLAEAKRCWSVFAETFREAVSQPIPYQQIQEQHFYMFVTDLSCAFAAWRVYQCPHPIFTKELITATEFFESLPACEPLVIPTNQMCLAALSFMLESLLPSPMRLIAVFAAIHAEEASSGRRTLLTPRVEATGGQARAEDAKLQLTKELAASVFRFMSSDEGKAATNLRMPSARDADQIAGYFEDALWDLLVPPVEGRPPLVIEEVMGAEGFVHMRLSFEARWVESFSDFEATTRSILTAVASGAETAAILGLARDPSGRFCFDELARIHPRDPDAQGFARWGAAFPEAAENYCAQSGCRANDLLLELERAHAVSDAL